MDKTKELNGVRKALILSMAKKPRSLARRSSRETKKEVKSPRGHVPPHTQFLTQLCQIQKRTTHCVLHHGAENLRATR